MGEEKADLNRAPDCGFTPVCIAAQNGHTEIVKLLAEEKADLNRASDNGATPVYVAAQNGHAEIVKFLIELNVNVEQIFRSILTGLFYSISIGFLSYYAII